MLRLLEEGEQQEACEAVLSYFAAAVLLQNESSLEIAPVSLSPVDAVCEQIIFEATGVHVDFDVHGAIEDLVHLGLIHAHGDQWRAVTLSEANRILNETWDKWFNE